MKLDPSERPDAMYRTLSSLVVPRPIGWISTLSADRQANLAPYSYFNAVTNDPPTVMFSASRSEGELKDSPWNAIDTGEFEHVGIETESAKSVDPPRVADAKATLECVVSETLEMGENAPVFGQVKQFHVDDALVTDGDVDASKVDAIGRFGGPYYTGTELLEFTRQY